MTVISESCLTWRSLSFDISSSDVYAPKPASTLLAEVALETVRDGERVLDACTGSGFVAIALATGLRNVSVAATDINPAAIESAQKNAARNGAHVELRLGDLYSPFGKEVFDTIVVHPPAVPYAVGEDWGLTPGMRVATDGGPDGSAMLLRAVHEATLRLRLGGRLLLLLPHWANHRRVRQTLGDSFKEVEQMAERQVCFFPAIEGHPTSAMLEHIMALCKAGTIEIDFDKESPLSRVSVLQATNR